jgi:uncharacterized protein (TIGR02266 family)
LNGRDDSRQSDRIPATLRIRLKYTDEATFVEKYSVNISRGGIFIATRSPKPVGTLLRFEFQLAQGEPLIRGEGSVVWVRPFDAAQPERSHGMGVRFTKLDGESRRVIERALSWKEQHPTTRAPGPSEPTVIARPAQQQSDVEPERRPEEDTRRVSLVSTIAQSQDDRYEPSPAEELFGPKKGEVERPLTIELEAEEASEEERLAPAPTTSTVPEPSSASPAAVEVASAPPVEPKPKAAAEDDDLEIRIEAEPDQRQRAAHNGEAKAGDADDWFEPEQATVVDDGSAAAALIRARAVAPTTPRLPGLDEALGWLPSRAARAAERGSDPVEQLAHELAISSVRLEAALAVARRESPRAQAAGGTFDEAALDRLLEPARPEPLPDPLEARARVARMLAAREDAADPAAPHRPVGVDAARRSDDS